MAKDEQLLEMDRLNDKMEKEKFPKARPSKLYTEEDFVNAIAAIKCGLSYRKAALHFGIPKSTLTDRIAGGKSKRQESIFTMEEESAFVEYFTTLSKRACGVNSLEIRSTIKCWLDNGNRKVQRFTDNMPTANWVTQFRKRHPSLVIRPKYPPKQQQQLLQQQQQEQKNNISGESEEQSSCYGDGNLETLNYHDHAVPNSAENYYKPTINNSNDSNNIHNNNSSNTSESSLEQRSMAMVSPDVELSGRGMESSDEDEAGEPPPTFVQRSDHAESLLPSSLSSSSSLSLLSSSSSTIKQESSLSGDDETSHSSSNNNNNSHREDSSVGRYFPYHRLNSCDRKLNMNKSIRKPYHKHNNFVTNERSTTSNEQHHPTNGVKSVNSCVPRRNSDTQHNSTNRQSISYNSSCELKSERIALQSLESTLTDQEKQIFQRRFEESTSLELDSIFMAWKVLKRKCLEEVSDNGEELGNNGEEGQYGSNSCETGNKINNHTEDHSEMLRRSSESYSNNPTSVDKKVPSYNPAAFHFPEYESTSVAVGAMDTIHGLIEKYKSSNSSPPSPCVNDDVPVTMATMPMIGET